MDVSYFRCLTLIVLTGVEVFAFSVKPDKSFEAAFQGQCHDVSIPCHHICLNHSPRTFECLCREGFRLDHNGYACALIGTTNRSSVEQTAVADRSHEPPFPVPNVQHNRQRLSQSPCATLLCLAGGVCAADRVHGYRCLCPLGRKGKHCEEHVTFLKPRFNGDSYALLPLPTDWDVLFDLKMDLRADTENGLVFYSGEDLTASKNYVALELVEGYAVFRLQMKNQQISLHSRYKIPLGDLVHIHAGRKGPIFYVQVAGEDRIVTTAEELEDSELKATENIYVGGMPDFDIISSGQLTSRAGFVGCVTELRINEKEFALQPLPYGSIIHGINIDRCGLDACQDLRCLNDGVCVTDGQQKAKCDCAVAYAGTRCEIDLSSNIPFFNGSSYLLYELVDTNVKHSTGFLVTFKPSNVSDGILFHLGRSRNSVFSDAMQLRLQNGHIELAFDLGEGYSILRSQQTILVGKWYQVLITRTGRYLELVLDGQDRMEILYNGAFVELNLPQNLLYVGGVEYSDVDDSLPSFQGCIDLDKTEFMGVKLKLSKALTGANLDTCRSN